VKVIADAASTVHNLVLRVRALEAPRAEISWPGPQEALSGNAQIIATAVTSPGTSLQMIELLVDGRATPGVAATVSPAVLNWNTRQVGDGPHLLAARATDKLGGTGESRPPGRVFIHNKGDGGGSGGGGAWETTGLTRPLSGLP